MFCSNVTKGVDGNLGNSPSNFSNISLIRITAITYYKTMKVRYKLGQPDKCVRAPQLCIRCYSEQLLGELVASGQRHNKPAGFLKRSSLKLSQYANDLCHRRTMTRKIPCTVRVLGAILHIA